MKIVSSSDKIVPFPITTQERENFKTLYPQHGDLLEQCILDGGVIVTDKSEGSR